MSDFKLLPDLKIIEKFVLDYPLERYAPLKRYFEYLHQIYKQTKLKYENLKNYKQPTEIIRLTCNLNKELNDIFFKLSRRINKQNIDLEKLEKTIDTLNSPDNYYVTCKSTNTFIKNLLEQTSELEKVCLKNYINEQKYNFYYKDSINTKIATLEIIFKKIKEIYCIN